MMSSRSFSITPCGSRSRRNADPRLVLLAIAALGCADRSPSSPEGPLATGGEGVPVLTRKHDTFKLDGRPISSFGIRVANALQNDEITQRLVEALDDLESHGMQSVALTIQGGRHTEGGNSAFNGFQADGSLDPRVADRLERVLAETAARNMVPVVTLFYRGRDQELDDVGAIRAAVVNTLEFLEPWSHAWVHLINEPNHPGFDHEVLTTASGQAELYRLAKRTDPDRIVNVGPGPGANDGFRVDTWARLPELQPPSDGNVSIEYVQGDSYDAPGRFDADNRARARRHAEAAHRSGGYWFWHAGWHQKADTDGWPRFDKGGAGTADGPGVAFIWNLMRELASR